MKNKTGAVIGRMHRGQNVITKLYEKGKRSKKRSEEQLASQDRLGKLSSFLSNIQGLVAIGFKQMVKHNSPANAAYSYNFDQAFITVGEELELNYSKLVYSLGNVEGPESPMLDYNDGTLNVSWFDISQSKYCQYSDKATVLVYEPNNHDSVVFDDICQRSDLNVLLDISCFLGKEVHCYVCFASADGKHQGNSLYLGLVGVGG